MKFYRNLVIVIAVVAAAILFLRLGAPDLVTAPATPPGAAAPPTGQPGQPAATQPGAPVPPKATPAPSTVEKITTLAQQEGVNIVTYSENGKTVNVVIDWAGDSVGPGGDFLDSGIKQGMIRDFKDLGSTMYYDKQGRRHFRASYEIYLN